MKDRPSIEEIKKLVPCKCWYCSAVRFPFEKSKYWLTGCADKDLRRTLRSDEERLKYENGKWSYLKESNEAINKD